MNSLMFWSSFSFEKTVGEWADKEIDLFPAHHLTLESYKRLDRSVKLYTYQSIRNTNIPDNVEILSADEFYPKEDAFSALSRGHSIAHVSDLVRFAVAAKFTGAVMDLDAVVLRDLPDDGFFASSPAKLTGAFAPKWGAAHPPLYIRDGSWDGKALSDFPVGIDEDMRHFSFNLYKMIEGVLKESPEKGSKSWCFVMWEIQKNHEKLPTKKVYEPLYFSPLPAWLPKGKCYSLEYPTKLGKTLFGYKLPTIEEILSKSYCVKHSFDSVYKGVNYFKENFWDTVHDESLLGREARFVLGDDWRKLL